MKTGFPIEYLRPEDKVLCLFAAKFEGFNDVQFVHQAGVRNAILVDQDEEMLLLTARKFNYIPICEDCFKFIDLEYFNQKGLFDVVISDQWGTQDREINEQYFHRLKKIAKRYLILGITERFYHEGTFPEGEYYLRASNGSRWRVIKIENNEVL